MNKRIPLSAASIVPLLAGSCVGDPAVSVPENARPNIIFIFSDDLGIGDLSCYGATRVATPHIDRLAAQGQRFTNAYATSATSTPSRFGLLPVMSRAPLANGIWGWVPSAARISTSRSVPMPAI